MMAPIISQLDGELQYVQQDWDGVNTPADHVRGLHPPGDEALVQPQAEAPEAVLDLLAAQLVVAVVVLPPHHLRQPLHLHRRPLQRPGEVRDQAALLLLSPGLRPHQLTGRRH